MSISIADNLINSKAFADAVASLYGKDADVAAAASKYASIAEIHVKKYGEGCFYSSPGRIELCGNHTDHNNGKVLCAAINVDTIACVTKRDDGYIIIESLGYPAVKVNISDLDKKPEEEGDSAALVRGVCKYYVDNGYAIGGFAASTVSGVFKGAGVSSSASFELLVAEILNVEFNGGKLDKMTKSKASYYAENVYFGKPSGLLDQSAISLGGVSYIDFKSTTEPVVESIDWKFSGVDIVITNTGGDHCDLTHCYSDIRKEMEQVAEYLGGKTLRDIDESAFYDALPQLQEKASGRAILRSVHYFDENKRVVEGAKAVKDVDFDKFAQVIGDSGISSYTMLQNCYAEQDKAQRIPLGICLSKKCLGVKAVRVHGGGFAGTILALVDSAHTADYVAEMGVIFGKQNVFAVNIRNDGACKVNI
ncbi:MAG: galactokinase [Clostridia bacterium]|nr:galactokinase [Clostridia bacterium]